MESFIKVVGGTVLAIALVFFLCVFGVIGGIIGGWVVGLFFTDLIIGTIGRFGVETAGLEVWHIGGTLAFIGSFFKSINTNSAS